MHRKYRASDIRRIYPRDPASNEGPKEQQFLGSDDEWSDDLASKELRVEYLRYGRKSIVTEERKLRGLEFSLATPR